MLRKIPVFSQWPEEHLRELLARTREIRAAAGKALVRQGETFKGLYLVLGGSIEVGASRRDGKRYIRRFAQPGTAFGFMSVFDSRGSPYSYVAHEPTQLLFLPKDDFIALLTRHPELWLSVARQLADFQRVALEVVQEQIFEGVRARLARALLSLAKAYPMRKDGGARGISVTQDDLAGLLGATRQSVSKELKGLERAGLVRVSYGRIAITDEPALARIAQDPIGSLPPDSIAAGDASPDPSPAPRPKPSPRRPNA